MSDDVTTAATIASLRAEVERLKAELAAASEREDSLQVQIGYVRAEVERVTSRATMDREEIESKRNDELTKALWASAEYIRRLEAEVTRLADEKRALREEMEELSDEEDRADSLSNSIIAACTGSGCLNAYELRQALDTARERAGVLEMEVKAWRHWNCENDKVGGDDEVDANANAAWGLLECCQRETDRTHALDAAKFGGA